MKKITVNMLSSADKVDGQGVGSAYVEQVKLIKDGANDMIEVWVNRWAQADIIHHHTIDIRNFIRMKKAKGANIAYVHFLPHTLDGSIHLPSPIFSIFKRYIILFYKSADKLVVVNPIFIDELASYGISKDKIHYIPNYVSSEVFHTVTIEEQKSIREKYEISKEAFVVLGVGQIQTRKGILDFIEVAKQNPDMMFVWAGGFSFGKITDGYEQLKKIKENPPQNVKFIGMIPRDEMNLIYNMSDVLFMPSYNELFPMSILEAMSSEKPLLLRDLELYEGILLHKYIVGSTNEEFSSKLKLLKQDQSFYQTYSGYAKELSAFYSKEHVLKIWRAFYAEVYEMSNQRKECKKMR